MGGVSAGGSRSGREDLVIHRVRRVVRRRLVGVAVAQVDMGEVLKAHQRAVAGGCVDIEGGLQRRHHQGIEIGDAPSLDDRHIGELGANAAAGDGIARNDDEAKPSTLQVWQPHRHLVRRVVRTRRVDDEVGRVRRNRPWYESPKPAGKEDLAPAVHGKHGNRHDRQAG